MTDFANEESAPPKAVLRPAEEMRLRLPPPRVVTLSKKAIVGGVIVIVAGLGGAFFFALRPHQASGPAKELYNTNNRTLPDGLIALPTTYPGPAKAPPLLGPALPGDLGKTMLNAGVTPGSTTTATAAEQKKQQILQERDAARTSHLFSASQIAGPQPVASASSGVPTPTAVVQATATVEDHKLAFLKAGSDKNTVAGEHVIGPSSPYVLQAGAVIAASLVTGLRSDLPGEITAQVTENVYDSPTGTILIIPQGAKLVGEYDAQVSFGQSRALMVWTRLIMPNGRSIVLDRLPGADPEGYAGVQDQTDNHWGALFKAAALSTLLSVGSEAGTSNSENNLAEAIRQGASQSFSQVGEQVVGKALSVQPTLTVRPGFTLRVMVTRDLSLEPYSTEAG